MNAQDVSESRFYMWRAIFAIAHADGKIDKEEEAFMDKHLRTVPFSLAQKAVLEDDIVHPKNAGEMLARVSDHEDQGMFFQFARMMCWSDGNYDIQEKEIMERLLGNHMEQLDIEGLTSALHESREDAVSRNAREEKYIEGQASKTTGIGPLIASFFASKNELPTDGVPESRFYMWRTIFAMAHADDEVTKEERDFMYDVLEKEFFSKEQRAVLEKDIDDPQDIGEAFMKIADQEDRSRFFYYARMMCWSDGNFDEQEQAIILKLRSVHARNVDFDKVLESVDMQLDDSHKDLLAQDMKSGNPLQNFFKRMRA